MLLDYEKSLLGELDATPALIVSAAGLDISSAVAELITLYANPNSLLVLLNASKTNSHLLSCIPPNCLLDISGLGVSERKQAYLRGGVFYGPSRAFITDFISRNILIEKISCIIVFDAENLPTDGTVAFILHIFHSCNSLGLVRAFSNNPILLSRRPLHALSEMLQTRSTILYPRFHEAVASSLPDIEVTRCLISQSELISEISFLIVNLIKKLYACHNNRRDTKDYTSIILYNCRSGELAEFYNLHLALYCCDAPCFYILYKRMYDRQINQREESKWIFTKESRMLLDKAKEYLLSGTDITAVPEDIAPSDPEDTSESSQNSSLLCSEMEFPESSKSGCFANKKLRKLISIIESSPGPVVCIVKNAFVKRRIIQVLDVALAGPTPGVFTVAEDIPREAQYAVAILLGPDLAGIRRLECLGCTIRDLRAFILLYRDSLEEQLYLAEMKEEKAAFDALVSGKLGQALNSTAASIDIEEDEEGEYRVVVDSREMAAKLPYYLYKTGSSMEVKMLQTGDYLLGTQCVERKSVEDFRNSLASGRLFRQAARMAFSYASPILLLEFEEGMPTLLAHERPGKFHNTLIAKLCVFVVHFPQFRILWSSRHVFSARLLRDVQKKEAADDSPAGSVDPVLQEILLGVSGITSRNLHRALKGFTSLRDLAYASLERLRQHFGEDNARTIHDFFRAAL